MLHRATFTLIFALLATGGCAFIQPDENILAPPDSRGAKISLPPGRSNVEKIESLTIDDVVKREEPSTAGLYDNSRYDFPITINSKVEGWMDYFTGRGRVHFERYLGRSSRYIPLMKHILRNAGLPEDLVYLAMIESGFNIRAQAMARAVGPWQFMPATGTRYGLRVDSWIDERQDPIRSTEAAARYLKDLYLMFESWYLAAAAYNAGENKLLRAVRELDQQLLDDLQKPLHRT
ncbi:MAG: lytic transglycosylase domain-containing protein [Bdellovibrionota bacterium]